MAPLEGGAMDPGINPYVHGRKIAMGWFAWGDRNLTSEINSEF